jgi:hypothetical protein
MAMSLPFVDRSSSSLPLQFVSQSKWGGWLKAQSAARRGWIESLGIAGAPGDLVTLPGSDGKAAGAVLVISDKPTLWDFGALATRLPPGTWRFADDTSPVSPTDAAVAIGLGAWRFDRYRSKKGKVGPRLLWPQGGGGGGGGGAPTRRVPRRSSRRSRWRAISSPRPRPTWGRPSSPPPCRGWARRTRPPSR